MVRKNIFRSLLLTCSLALTAAATGPKDTHEASTPLAPPPKTTVNEVKELLYGTEIVDPYRWLEDQNSPQTRAWIDAQNAYTGALLAKIPGREALEQQVSALLKIDAMDTPVVAGNRYFFSKRQADQDHSSLFVREGLAGKDELFELLPFSPDRTFFVNSISKDGKLLAYFVRQGRTSEMTPHLYDVDARKELPDVFPKARYAGFSILDDNSGVYLTRLLSSQCIVSFHKIGTDPATDVEVFKGYFTGQIIGSYVTHDGRYLQITTAQPFRTDIYLKDLVHNRPMVAITKDFPAVFQGQIAGDRMYVRTDWKAPQGRIMEVDLTDPPRDPAMDKWREVVPEGDGVLDSFTLVGGMLAVRFTKNVAPRLKIFDPSGKLVREVTPPALGSISGLSGQWDSNEAFFTFSSFHIPPTIYRYDLATGRQAVWFAPKVPIESAKYEVSQVWYTAKDGTKISMLLAHAKGLKLDGSNPVLLTGHGGFYLSSNSNFNSFAATWLANGGVYAMANLRGGGAFDESWFRGMLEKQNVFDDFIAAAEWLIQNKYTSPAKLAIRGIDNGGLLVGVALTQRPDLFGAVVCGYPLLDMVRYQNFLVAKKHMLPEYGSPKNEEQFKYLYAFSPYQHVKAGTKYPSVLFISGDSDTGVAPLHARKMTAFLQAATSGSDHPILLHYDTAAGHSGGTPAGKQIENTTDELSYLFWQLGVTVPAKQQAANPGHHDSLVPKPRSTATRGSIEILSDTMGVNFGPYTKPLRFQVYSHWEPLIPEVALPPIMKQGVVVIEFSIRKDGTVQDMELVSGSGDVALDRAAWGAIANADPLPRLPLAFAGDSLKIRARFFYNPDGPDLQKAAQSAKQP